VLTETYCNKVNIQITQRDGFIQIVIGNPRGLVITGLITGVVLIIANWKKVKCSFASF